MAATNPFDQFDAASAPVAAPAPASALPPASAVAATGGADLPVPSPASTPAPTSSGNPFDQFDENQPTSWGRAAGLDARSLITGAAGLAGAVAGMPQQVASDVNAAIHGNPRALLPAWAGGTPPTPAAPASQGQTPQLSDFVHPDKWQQAAEYFADKAGLPSPRTPGEQVSSAAVGALPAVALAPEAADAEAPEAATFISRALQAARPAVTPLAVAGSGAASQAVANEGGSPGEQLAAGLAAGGLPALLTGGAGLVRTVARGAGDDAAAAMQARIAAAKAAGVDNLGVAAAGDQPFPKVVQATSRALWGGGPINTMENAQRVALGNKVSEIVSNLAGDNEPTPTNAGAAINVGAAASKLSTRAAEKAAYANVDQFVPPTTPVDVSGTLAKLNELATPTPGAEETTGALIHPAISAMRDQLTTDSGASGTIPYSAARSLRTDLGTNHIDWGFDPADPQKNGAYKQVYNALTQDINAAVPPDAVPAVKAANTLHQQNVAQSRILGSIVNKVGGPEAVYSAALNGTKAGATKVSAIMSTLNDDQKNLFRATILNELGRAIPSERTAEDAFNASTFLTRWNGLSNEAKNAIFGASGTSGESGKLRAALDNLTGTMEAMRNSGALKNPSGTGGLLGHILGGFEKFGKAGEIAGDLVLGHFAGIPHAAAGLVGGAFANRALASALTSPRVVRWLANTSRMPVSALPVAISQLSRMGKKGHKPAAALASAMQQPGFADSGDDE